jgi:hypothetical protein
MVIQQPHVPLEWVHLRVGSALERIDIYGSIKTRWFKGQNLLEVKEGETHICYSLMRPKGEQTSWTYLPATEQTAFRLLRAEGFAVVVVTGKDYFLSRPAEGAASKAKAKKGTKAAAEPAPEEPKKDKKKRKKGRKGAIELDSVSE